MIFGRILFLFFVCFSFAASSQPKFLPSELAGNPTAVPDWSERFRVMEVDCFNPADFRGAVILENGYASPLIRDASKWNPGVPDRVVEEVILVFTDYPRNRADWITNYDWLLGSRLNALFAVDPKLNSREIRYSILLQTQCRTDREARAMFHGIVIRYHRVIREREGGKSRSGNIQDSVRRLQPPDDWQTFPPNNGTMDFDRFRTVPGSPVKPKKKDPKCPDFRRPRKF